MFHTRKENQSTRRKRRGISQQIGRSTRRTMASAEACGKASVEASGEASGQTSSCWARNGRLCAVAIALFANAYAMCVPAVHTTPLTRRRTRVRVASDAHHRAPASLSPPRAHLPCAHLSPHTHLSDECTRTALTAPTGPTRFRTRPSWCFTLG